MRWLKMRDTLEIMAGRSVAILLTTELPQNIRSAVEFSVYNNQSVAVIMLNAKYAKSWDDIVESVSHEITHVKNDNEGHEERYNNWSELVSKNRIDFLERMGNDNENESGRRNRREVTV